MSDARGLAAVGIAAVCLGVTDPAVTWADRPRPAWLAGAGDGARAAPGLAGTSLRLGTAVGFLYREQLGVLALGGVVAVGHRFGAVALESEYGYFGFQVRGPSSVALGAGHRLGLVARLDAVQVGSRAAGTVALYLEGGAAVAWDDWYRPRFDEAPRVVPADRKRVEGQLGFGVKIEHRLREPLGVLRGVGWLLGWRLALAPPEAGPSPLCRGPQRCRVAAPPAGDRWIDRSMLFQSSFALTW